MTIPHIFIEYFQANEDYYINFYYSSVSRFLRVIGFVITISLPAVFTALLAYHQEVIPTPLIMSIAAARQGVPLPIAVETIMLLFVFELLRETGIRMPTNIGQALSIVGALVLGQAAVDARFVSAPIVIVVALTGICGLIIPRMKGAIILLRLIFLALASFLGLYGYVFGLSALLIYLLEMRSFGVPFMYTLTSLESEELKDTAIRVPWVYMKYRPQFITATNHIRKIPRGKKQ